jgi:hypothetical protein
LRGGQPDEALHAGGLGLGYFPAERGQPVVASPFVVQMRVWAVLGLLDQSLLEHPAEAFNFGSALDRIGKSASQLVSDPRFVSVAGTALPILGGD